jgi:cathepsin L
LEGLTKIADGTLKALSDQQLIDCAGTTGCHGGFPGQGFTWVKQHGICTAEEYPWKGVGQACQKTTGSFKISSIAEIRNSCTDLSNAIHKGPVSVVVDATNWSTYASGVFNHCATSVNHAVTLVG